LLRNFHSDVVSPASNNDANQDEWILSMAHLLLSEYTAEELLVNETLKKGLPDLQKLLNISDSQVDELREEIKNTTQG